jgi:hypothetical protein
LTKLDNIYINTFISSSYYTVVTNYTKENKNMTNYIQNIREAQAENANLTSYLIKEDVKGGEIKMTKKDLLKAGSEKARSLFESYPCGNDWNQRITQNQIAELALESARVLGTGYLHRAELFADDQRQIDMRAYFSKPNFNEANGHPWSYEEIIARTGESKTSFSMKTLLEENLDIDAEVIFEMKGGAKNYNGVGVSRCKIYKLTRTPLYLDCFF